MVPEAPKLPDATSTCLVHSVSDATTIADVHSAAEATVATTVPGHWS